MVEGVWDGQNKTVQKEGFWVYKENDFGSVLLNRVLQK